MKRHSKGQGLVEYALILVLVAIVVLAVLLLVGPAVSSVYCDIVFVLNDREPSGDFDTTHIVSMGTSAQSVTFDIVVSSYSSCSSKLVVDILGDPSHGTVVNPSGGTFTYTPVPEGSGTDDSFTLSWYFSDSSDPYFSLVTIIVGEPDPLASQAYIMSSAEQTTQEFDAVNENILALFEAAEEQEESLQEGVDLSVEAVVEGLEVLIDSADDNDNQALSGSLSQLLQEVKDGSLDADSEVITQIGTDLTDAPLEGLVPMILKMAPRLVDSCVMVSNGSVSPDTIAAAIQAVEGLDDEDHPGKEEALQLLQVVVGTIDGRNIAVEVFTDFQSEVLGIFISGLELAGKDGLAEQIAADSEACGN